MKCLRVFNYVACVGLVTVARCGEWPGRGTTLLFHLSRKYGRVLGRRKCVTNAVFQKSAEKRAVQVPQKNVWAIDCRINSLSGMNARLRPLMPANPNLGKISSAIASQNMARKNWKRMVGSMN